MTCTHYLCYDECMDKYKSVEEFLEGLDDDRRAQVVRLREYILDAAPRAREHIKWNAPSYMINDEDRITFNTVNKDQTVKLVFHMGATRKEDRKREPILKDAALVEWVSDIRGYVTFITLDEIISNEKGIKKLVRDWLELS